MADGALSLTFERLAGLVLLGCYGSNVYYIKEQTDGTWTPGTIISNGTMQVISFTETVKVRRAVVA